MRRSKSEQQAINEATWRLQAKVEEQKATLDAFKQGINDLIDKHAPNITGGRLDYLHPGWSDSIPIYCAECSRSWPCTVINDLRALYGKATGWEPATIPYSPLVIPSPRAASPVAARPDTGEGAE